MLTSFRISKRKSSTIRPKVISKILKLYNQYPGCYESFSAMTADLQRIRAMGFEQVWVNPFYDTCKDNFLNPQKTDCPYAMRDHHSINPEYGISFRDVKKYTQRAHQLGLSPLFDLVARHVAIDHPLVKGDPKLLAKGIDTTKWFKRHPNGNFVIYGMDQNYVPTKADPWSDVIEFDYSNQEICEQIFNHFWKPFIDFNIIELGFKGARLDAVGSISRNAHALLLPYINKVCQQQHQQDAYLVAETVGLRHLKDSIVVQGLVTHTMNNVFWMPGPEGRDDDYALWQDEGNWHETSKMELQKIAVSAGHSGSHDEDRYPKILKEKGVADFNLVKERMLEMIMTSAFSSEGGHILAYGDEYGVVDRVNLLKRKVINLETEKKYDLSVQIKAINDLLDTLPEPAPRQWTQRVFLKDYSQLVVFIVHQGEGFAGNSHIIVGNTQTDGPSVIIDQKLLNEILANHRNQTATSPQAIYSCTKVKIDPDLMLSLSESKPNRNLKAVN